MPCSRHFDSIAITTSAVVDEDVDAGLARPFAEQLGRHAMLELDPRGVAGGVGQRTEGVPQPPQRRIGSGGGAE